MSTLTYLSLILTLSSSCHWNQNRKAEYMYDKAQQFSDYVYLGYDQVLLVIGGGSQVFLKRFLYNYSKVKPCKLVAIDLILNIMGFS